MGPADLLVSPEFAGVLTSVLGVGDLTGADVGDAQIDAELTHRLPLIQVKATAMYGKTTVNGSREVAFPSLDVESLAIATGDGRDSVRVYGVSLEGGLSVDVGGDRFNWATLHDVHVGTLSLSGGSGLDRFSVRNSRVEQLFAETRSGRDRFTLLRTRVER